MSSNRHQKRTLVIQAVFLWEASGKDPKEALSYVCREFDEDPLAEREFEQSLLQGVVTNIREIKKSIPKFAPDWPIDRISPADRAILYLAFYEMMFTDTPHPVIINEAVDLAKEFGGERSYKFINGALSAANKDLQKNESKAEAMVQCNNVTLNP